MATKKTALTTDEIVASFDAAVATIQGLRGDLIHAAVPESKMRGLRELVGLEIDATLDALGDLHKMVSQGTAVTAALVKAQEKAAAKTTAKKPADKATVKPAAKKSAAKATPAKPAAKKNGNGSASKPAATRAKAANGSTAKPAAKPAEKPAEAPKAEAKPATEAPAASK